MRARIKQWLEDAVGAACPAILGDIWGRSGVTVLVEELSLSQPSLDGAVFGVSGRVTAQLFADNPDEIDLDAILPMLHRGLGVSAPATGGFGGFINVTGVAERLTDDAGVTVLVVRMTAEGGIYPPTADDPLLSMVTMDDGDEQIDIP